jgi:putative FmdB family regulatory protein
MPLYEYACEQCGHSLTKLQKLSEAPLKECPQCHQMALQKMISSPAFKLEGTGWYETDFKDNKKTSEKKSDDKSTLAASTDPVPAKTEHKHTGEGCC